MSRLAILLGLAVVATAPAWVWNPYHLHTLIMAGIFAVLALSLNLLLGYTGQLSLGHAAFFGIGAYATGLLTVKLEWSPWIGLQERVVGREPREEVARGLRTAQASLLREDGIHPRSILVGSSSGLCHCHGIVPPCHQFPVQSSVVAR